MQSTNPRFVWQEYKTLQTIGLRLGVIIIKLSIVKVARTLRERMDDTLINFWRKINPVLIGVFILGFGLSANARLWETSTGEHFEAELLEYRNGIVILRMADGGKSLYALEKISEADREYVRKAYPGGDKKKSPPRTTTPVDGNKPSGQLTSRSKAGGATVKNRPVVPATLDSGTLNYKVGQTAPNLSGQYPKSSRSVDLNELRGKVVVIDFWAAWCVPCRVEVPKMVELYSKYNNRGFEILGVSLDKSWAPVVKFRDAYGMQWPMALDKFRYITTKWGVKSIPTLVLIDQNGVIVANNLRAGTLEPYLRKYLGIR